MNTAPWGLASSPHTVHSINAGLPSDTPSGSHEEKMYKITGPSSNPPVVFHFLATSLHSMKTYKTRKQSISRAAATRIEETSVYLRKMTLDVRGVSLTRINELLEVTRKIHEVTEILRLIAVEI